MKRLTIRLDDDLHKALRFLSVETGEPIQAMAVRLLRAEVRRAPGGRRPRKPSTKRGGGA